MKLINKENKKPKILLPQNLPFLKCKITTKMRNLTRLKLNVRRTMEH